jgi:cytochrome c biogenesis protein CcmG/thiol:disulfide interchange protein DsbE
MVLPPVIFAALAGMFYVGMYKQDKEQLPTAFAGRDAPAVAVTPLADKPVFDDAALRDGQIKLVNFWASWCAPCRVEHPSLTQLAAEGIPVYGVNYQDKPEAALKFLGELGDPYTAIGADEAGRMALEWGVYGVPETYLVDGEGKIILRIAGPVIQRNIEDTLRPALEQLKDK